jgi:saccharopine dehydrogenase (NAD+, L-lysine-forming)
MEFNTIIIRNETKKDEHRTPLIPEHCGILIKKYNYKIYVETSKNRCYSDNDYENEGCIIIDEDIWINIGLNNKKCIILGLKELSLDHLKKLDNHQHVYFSHFIKNNNPLINNFFHSNSKLFDLEYFIDNNNKRLTSFGYYAGICGINIGLKEWSKISHKKIEELNICIIGPNGNSGLGVRSILDNLNVKYKCLYTNDAKNNLWIYDIIVNCIKLSNKIDPFITKHELINFNKTTLIIDISCDPTHPFNPFPIYNKTTTFNEIVLKINDNLNIISIDNLPSYYSLESSNYFSNLLYKIFINNEENRIIWERCYSFYNNLKLQYYQKK